MQPKPNNSRARLVTKLGQNSDLIEMSLETSQLMIFRQKHTLRMIRSVFPYSSPREEEIKITDEEEDEEENDQVIGFKLASRSKELGLSNDVQIYLT